MKLIVCLDDQNGILFNGRRLSMDSCLRKRILEVTQDSTLWMNQYSARQFANIDSRIQVEDAFLQRAPMGAYCFLENADVSTCKALVEELIVYRWNRLYPSDTAFPLQLFCGWKKVSSFDFLGSSHEKLTEEVYRP